MRPIEQRSAGPNRARTVRVLAGLALVLAASVALPPAGGCADPESGSPAAAYLAVSAALEANDAAALYDTLTADLQADLRALHDTIRDTVALVGTAYPPEGRDAARTAAGAALLERADGPEALFRELMAGREAAGLSSLQRLGSAPADTVVEGDTARVRTRGGDVWQFRRASDDTWRWVPPEADRAIVRAALEQARRNRDAIQAHLRELDRLRTRGVVRALSPDAVAPADEGEGEGDTAGGDAASDGAAPDGAEAP